MAYITGTHGAWQVIYRGSALCRPGSWALAAHAAWYNGLDIEKLPFKDDAAWSAAVLSAGPV